MDTPHRTTQPNLTQATAVGIVTMLGRARPSEVCDVIGAQGVVERGNVALMLRDLRLAGHLVKTGDVYQAAVAARKEVALGN